MKRTRYIVYCPDGHSARFSSQWHARLFAVALSERMPDLLIEMSARDGLIGQYRAGVSTPEFEQHHDSGYYDENRNR
jgi:hypothetical protein